MERLARVFFVFTLILGAGFIIFFLFYFKTNDELLSVKTDREGLKTKLGEFTVDINRLNVDKQNLESQLKRFLEATDTTYSTDEATINFLKAQISTLNDELALKEGEISRLLQEMDLKIAAAIENQKAAYSEDLARMKDTYEAELKKYSDEVFFMKNEVLSLQAQIEQMKQAGTYDEGLQNRIDTLENLLSEKNKEVNSLNVEINSKISEIADLKTRLEDFQNSENQDPLAAKIVELTTEIENLKLQIEEKDSTIAVISNSLLEYENGFPLQEKFIDQINDLNAELTDREGEISDLKTRLNDLELKLEAKTGEGEDSAKIASLEEKVSELEKMITVKEGLITDLSSKVADYQKEVSDLNTKLEERISSMPIILGEKDAVRYKYLILGEDNLSAKKYIASADYFSQAQLDTLPLGDLSIVYSRKRELAYRMAIAEYYNIGYPKYLEKDYTAALASFEKGIRLGKEVSTDYSDDLIYHSGLSYLNLGDFQSAIVNLELIITEGNSIYVPHSLYNLLKIYLDLKNYSSAKKYAEELLNYPEFESYAKNVLRIIGE